MDRAETIRRWALSHVNFGVIPIYRAVGHSPTLHCGAGATGKQGQLIIELWKDRKQ